MARRPARRNPYRTNTGIHIEWFTVRRSTVYTLIALLIAFAGASFYAYQQVFGPRQEQPVALANQEPNKASFLDVSGTVEVRKSGTYEWVNANMAMALNRDDTIRTAGGEARVRLFDGTEYLIKPHSILVIERANEDPNTKAKLVGVKLETGQLNVSTPRQDNPGSRSELQTPTSQGTIAENTVADVSYDSSTRRTGLTVFTGTVAVRAGGSELTLGPRQSVGITADQRFSRVIELPGVPAIVSPANLDVLAVNNSMEFRWRPVEGARRYHVVLDRSPYFPDPILESNVSGVNILHNGLEPGTYYWQVTAIDGDDRRGAPSEFAKFTVSSRPQSSPPPELQVFRPSVTLGGLVTIRGRTAAGAVVTVDWGMGDERVDVKADGSFIHYFEVREAGSHRVVVKSRRRDGGGVAEKTVFAETGTD